MGAIRTWDSELKRLLMEEWKVGQVFTLVDVYRFEPYFKTLYASNSHIQDKLRQTMQNLRQESIVEFVDNAGTYRRI